MNLVGICLMGREYRSMTKTASSRQTATSSAASSSDDDATSNGADTLACSIARGGVRMVLKWLRFRHYAHAWHAEALAETVEDSNDLWALYVEDVEPGSMGGWHHCFWCGAWLWNRNCRMRQRCKFVHPDVHLKLCDGTIPANVNSKMIPVRRVNLHSSEHIPYERIIFVEHAKAGIVWGRVFNSAKNAILIASFLQSPWLVEAFPHSQPLSLAIPAVSSIPDTCWHQVATAAGLRTLLKLQVALGPNVQWGPWLHQATSGNQTENSSHLKLAERKAIDYTVVTAKSGRARCAECLQWRGYGSYDRCGNCNHFLCQQCSGRHICKDLVQLANVEVNADHQCLQAECLGSLLGAAADCAAITSALRARAPLHCRRARSNVATSSMAGSAVVSGLVEQSMREQPPLLPSRVLDCGSEVLAACYSSALLAVQSRQQVRVIRRDDWKTLVSAPAPPARSWDLGLEVLEDKSILIATADSGLSVLNLETRSPTLVPTQGEEWQLRAIRKGLLTASTSTAALRDLERPNLPLVHTWSCCPLGLGSTGAIVVPACSGGQHLQWLDPRQPDLVASDLLSDYEGFEKSFRANWTAAALAGKNEYLAVLGTAMGDLAVADLRQPKVPVWTIKHLGHGSVRRIHVTDRMIFTRTVGSPLVTQADSGRAHDPLKLTHAVSWQGRSLAAFAGLHVFATASGSAPGTGPLSKSLLACGVGNSVLVVGAAPAVGKERSLRCDDTPHNGHKSRVWERGTRHSNNRRN